MAKSGTATHASNNKPLLKVCEALEARYGQRRNTKTEDFIEALVYQILELGVPEKNARDALKRIHDEFVDWNDMRVSTVREIEDILGEKYYRRREKAEDLKHLLADLYTAYRKMDLSALLNTEGIETLRALPETTLIRKDMVERALLLVLDVKIFPSDEDQVRLLKFLDGVPKQLTTQQVIKKVEESLEAEDMLRLSRGLREHQHFLDCEDESDPQPIGFKWNKADPLGMGDGKKGKKKK
jgi:endonuclease III